MLLKRNFIANIASPVKMRTVILLDAPLGTVITCESVWYQRGAPCSECGYKKLLFVRIW